MHVWEPRDSLATTLEVSQVLRQHSSYLSLPLSLLSTLFPPPIFFISMIIMIPDLEFKHRSLILVISFRATFTAPDSTSSA